MRCPTAARIRVRPEATRLAPSGLKAMCITLSPAKPSRGHRWTGATRQHSAARTTTVGRAQRFAADATFLAPSTPMLGIDLPHSAPFSPDPGQNVANRSGDSSLSDAEPRRPPVPGAWAAHCCRRSRRDSAPVRAPVAVNVRVPASPPEALDDALEAAAVPPPAMLRVRRGQPIGRCRKGMFRTNTGHDRPVR